jgi:hypothetical protein
LSWIHELAPMVPTPAAIAKDVRACWVDYRSKGLGRRTSIAFCTLRATQRIAYWVGWTAGSKEYRSWTPS